MLARHEPTQADDHKRLVATAQRAVADGEAAANEAAAKAAAAKDRAERIKRGEDVPGGISKPLTRETFDRILHEAGWNAADIKRAELLATLTELEFRDDLMPALRNATDRVEKAVTCRFIKNRQRERANG